MDTITFVNSLTNKNTPLLRMFLLLKYKAPKNFYIYLLLIAIKFLGLLIVALNFTPSLDASYNYRYTNLLRKFTIFGMLSTGFTFGSYFNISIIIFLFILTSAFFLLKYYLKLKKIEDFLLSKKGHIYNKAISIIFIILLFTCQHILEYLSLIYAVYFNTTYNKYELFTYFFKTNDKFSVFLLIGLNSFNIILLNIFIYFSFHILNEPFFDSNFPIQMKVNKLFDIFYILVYNLQGIHYFEYLLPNENYVIIMKISIFLIIILMCSIIYFHAYSRYFNFFNFTNLLVEFVITFSFFSQIIELSLYLDKTVIYNSTQLIFILICKVSAAICFITISRIFTEYAFLRKCKLILFQDYMEKISSKDLETLYYFIYLLLKLKKVKVKDYSSLMKILLEHKTECGVDQCRCNLVEQYRFEFLMAPMKLIIEEIFSNLNLYKQRHLNILFAEYLYLVKNSDLYSYATLRTYLSKSSKPNNNLKMYPLYVLKMKRILEYSKNQHNNNEYVAFKLIFNHIKIKNNYDDKITNFIENFEIFLKFKQAFDSTLKFDVESNKLDSFCFKNLNSIVQNCLTFQTLYRDLKKQIKHDFEKDKCKNLELSFKLYLFFEIFNKEVPKKIKNIIFLNTGVELNSSNNMNKYFSNKFNTFFSNNNLKLNMIIEINSIYKIRYISLKLAYLLGYNTQSALIGKDLHNIFPLQLRSSHKKIILDYLLLQRNYFFVKTTIAFTKRNNMTPINLRISCLPNMGENPLAIASCQHVKDPEEDKNFYFVLSDNYDLVAISENFDLKYSINYDLIDKLNIDMSKLFELGDSIDKHFKYQLNNIAQHKKDKQLESLYNMTFNLFNLNLQEDSTININDFQQSLRRRNNATQNFSKVKNKRVLKSDLKLDEIRRLTEYGFNFDRPGTVNTNVDISDQFDQMAYIEQDQQRNSESAESSFSVTSSISSPMKSAPSASPLKKIRTSPTTMSPLKNRLQTKVSELSETNNNNDHKNVEESSLQQFTMMMRNKKKSSKKFGLFEMMMTEKIDEEDNDNDVEMSEMENTTISDESEGALKEDSFSVQVDKHLVIKNLEKIMNSSKDLDAGQNFINKLNEAIFKLKSTIKSKPVRNKKIPKYNFLKTFINNSLVESFKIKVIFKKIGLTPFFLVKVKEKIDFVNKISFGKQITKNKVVLDSVSEEAENKLDKKKGKKISKFSLTNIQEKINEDDEHNNNNYLMKGPIIRNMMNKKGSNKPIKETISEQNISGSGSSDSDTPEQSEKLSKAAMSLHPILKQQIVSKISSPNLNLRGVKGSNRRKDFSLGLNYMELEELELKRSEEELIRKKHKMSRRKHKNRQILSYSILVLTLFINVSVCFLTFFMKLHTLNTTQSLFILGYWNKLSQASFISLHSSVISYILLLDDLTTFDTNYIVQNDIKVSYSDIKEILSLRTSKFRDDFTNFKTNTQNSLFPVPELEYQFYNINKTLETTLMTWENLNYTDNIISIFEYISTNLEQMSLDDKYDDIKYDFDNAFLFSSFNNTEKVQASRSSKILYFININFLKINQIFKEFDDIIVLIDSNFENNLEKITLIIEILNIIFSINLLVVIFYDLKAFDRALFRTVVSMFINLRKGKDIEFTSEVELGILKMKTNSYRQLVKIFHYKNVKLVFEAIICDPHTANITNMFTKRNNKYTPASKVLNFGASILDKGLQNNKNSMNSTNLNGSMLDNSSSLINPISNNMNKNIPGSPKKGNRTKSNKKADAKELDIEKLNNITNRHILKHCKQYPIRFIELAKILISIIFTIFIIFLIVFLVMNTIFLQNFKEEINLTNVYLLKYPAIYKMFNSIRLMIISKDLSYTNTYQDFLTEFSIASQYSDELVQSYSDQLVNTYNFEQILLNTNNTNLIKNVCNNPIQYSICKVYLEDKNGYNHKGVPLGSITTVQVMNNILKDYTNLYQNKTNPLFITSKDGIMNYFYNEVFAKLNVQVEYILYGAISGYFDTIYLDMTNLFTYEMKLNLIMGVALLLLNIFNIVYVVMIFFNKVKTSMGYVGYSAKKFNIAMFQFKN